MENIVVFVWVVAIVTKTGTIWMIYGIMRNQAKYLTTRNPEV